MTSITKFYATDIEESKFKAETEWEEKKIGLIQQELTIKMEKFKAETKQEESKINQNGETQS